MELRVSRREGWQPPTHTAVKMAAGSGVLKEWNSVFREPKICGLLVGSERCLWGGQYQDPEGRQDKIAEAGSRKYSMLFQSA